jgi:leader peptidase (prepilin peptidase)/N-methyltransferase
MENFLDVIVWLWLGYAFVLGAIIGSLLNVCIVRLPLDKSILWPGSHCGRCYQPVRGYDNIPLLSYWLLGGQCRTCKAKFSVRYFVVELFTACAFAGLFYLEVLNNWHELPALRDVRQELRWGHFLPLPAIALFIHHTTLLSLLIVATVCDLDGRIIPLSVTLPGTALGLLSATLYPWPWPTDLSAAGPFLGTQPWWIVPGPLPTGIYPWPAWGPVPNWLSYDWHLMGLLNGVVGALVGTFLLRAVGWVFSRGLGREALGLGDADLMMMAGSFLGWQPVIVAFFVGALAALVLIMPVLFVRWVRNLWAKRTGTPTVPDTTLPFGPGLSVGIVLTWLWWPTINREEPLRFLFFHELILLAIGVFGLVLTFAASFGIGLVQGRGRG